MRNKICLLFAAALLGFACQPLSITAHPHYPANERMTARLALKVRYPAHFYYVRGQQLYRKGRLNGAIEELYTAVNLREDYPEAQLLLARVLVMSERSREAVSTLRGLVSPHRSSAQALKLFGWAYYRMNRLNAAEETLETALSNAARSDPETHYLLGLVRLRQQAAEEAIRQAKRALALKPRYVMAYRLLSDAYLLQGKDKLAQDSLQRQLAFVGSRRIVREIQQRLRSLQSMNGAKENLTPEVLPKVLSVPTPSYTSQARRNQVEGVVRLKVLFGNDGRIQQIFVQQGLGYGLDEEAIRAAQRIDFTPGRLQGKPVSIWAGVTFRFQLKDAVPPERKIDPKQIAETRIERL